MPDSYKALERQVQRIHRLLEDAGASVIWNERIPDPDNPEQLRQIDVSIRRDGTFTMIECRDHKSPQDVKWIEEIIGRRISLEADSVIAVSSSGFTRGAKAKAINNGVILRDFATLTDNEISEWGQRSEFSLIFCEFRDVKLLLEVTGVPTRQPALTTESGKSIDLSEPLRGIANEARSKVSNNSFHIFKTKLPTDLLVDGIRPKGVAVQGRIRTRIKRFQKPIIRKYLDATNNDRKAIVENFPIGETQIIRGPKTCTLVFDLSEIKIPDRCIFCSPVFHDPNGIVASNAEIVGTANIMKFNIKVDIEIAWNRIVVIR